MKKVMIGLVILALIVVVPYVAAGWSEAPLTEEIRAERAPGKTLVIDDGTIHYLERGPKDGPVIVMVHGFSTPHFIFEQNAQAMADAGYRVIQFDHFGRGWSDRPDGPYDTSFYDRELLQVLDGLGLDEPVGLVGLSMGGVITTEFVANHPERVSKLFLLVPAGIKNFRDPEALSTQAINTPIIGDWIWRVFGKQILLGRADDQTTLTEANRLQGEVTEQLQFEGYFPALLSTLRNLPMSGRDETFRRAAATGVPIAAIFGGADETIPVESAEMLIEIAPAIDVEVFESGTHGLNFQQHEPVNERLLEFFSSE